MAEQVDLSTQLERLGVGYPKGLAFLPSNVLVALSNDEFYYPKLVPDLERVLEQHDLVVERLTPHAKRSYVESRASEWVLPILAVGDSIVTTANLLSVVLNVLSSYLYDRMKRVRAEPASVRMSLVKRTAEGTEWLSYEGPVEGLRVISSWHLTGGPGREPNIEPRPKDT
jgi:hypothetical protein